MVSPIECLRYLVSCAHTSDLLRTSFGSAILDRCERPQSTIPCKHGYPAVHTFCWNTSNICRATFRQTTCTSCETPDDGVSNSAVWAFLLTSAAVVPPCAHCFVEKFCFCSCEDVILISPCISFMAHHTFPSSSYIVLYLRTWHIALLIWKSWSFSLRHPCSFLFTFVPSAAAQIRVRLGNVHRS